MRQKKYRMDQSSRNLYKSIVEHRRTITPLRGIDCSNNTPDKINPIPPAAILNEWKKDYKTMQEFKIYKESLPFDKLIERIKILKETINGLAAL